ncbi:NADH:ubiquinone oxidoreductase subunit NDUFA12 [Lentibacter sp.]|uniref:NADH:ubiquinone oxidoreductase subunit NDUFA12 n=1 Tax=Lentibacter sp. TaxID=2024994 RepID=UPI003F6AD441
MGILKKILRVATWWNGSTLNTQFYSWRKGQPVGEDSQGNKFFETRDGKRRWVMFNGTVEASRVDAEWHGWLHHTYKEPPTKAPLVRKAWEKPHEQNHTGTPLAYAPEGSLRRAEPKERRDYEAWVPE